MTQDACDKTNTLPKIKNCTDYTMVCIHYLVWGIVVEIRKEIMEKNPTQENFEQKPTTMSRKKWDSTMDNNIVMHRNLQEQLR